MHLSEKTPTVLETDMKCGRLGTLIFSRIHRLGLFFWVQNSEFHFFGGFSEKKIFWGMKILLTFLGGGVITKLG